MVLVHYRDYHGPHMRYHDYHILLWVIATPCTTLILHFASESIFNSIREN